MALVLPFPLSRRTDLVRRQAEWFLAQDTERAAESNLRRLLEIQRQALASKGVDAELIEHEATSLEAAIRAAVLRYTYGEAG